MKNNAKFNMINIFLITFINISALAFTQTTIASSYDIPEWVYSDVFTHNLPTKMYRTNTLEFDHKNVRYPLTRPINHNHHHNLNDDHHNYVKQYYDYDFEHDNVKQINEAFIDAFNDIYYDEIQKKLLDAQGNDNNEIPRADEMEKSTTSTTPITPMNPRSIPYFDDYFIPSWVYKKSIQTQSSEEIQRKKIYILG